VPRLPVVCLFDGRAGNLASFGDNDGQHISEVGRATTFRNHDRPISVDDADPSLTGDVGSGEHGVHSIDSERSRDVDRNGVGAGVVGELDCAVQHSRQTQVIDERALADRKAATFILHTTRPDASRLHDDRYLVLRERLDGIEHLDVTSDARSAL